VLPLGVGFGTPEKYKPVTGVSNYSANERWLMEVI